MSGGGPNNANRCARPGTLDAAISVLLLFVLDTNATNTLDKSESLTRTTWYINGRGRRRSQSQAREAVSEPDAAGQRVRGDSLASQTGSKRPSHCRQH